MIALLHSVAMSIGGALAFSQSLDPIWVKLSHDEQAVVGIDSKSIERRDGVATAWAVVGNLHPEDRAFESPHEYWVVRYEFHCNDWKSRILANFAYIDDVLTSQSGASELSYVPPDSLRADVMRAACTEIFPATTRRYGSAYALVALERSVQAGIISFPDRVTE